MKASQGRFQGRKEGNEGDVWWRELIEEEIRGDAEASRGGDPDN